MNEPAAALRPLREADDAIRRLHEYDSEAELASAVQTVAAAVDRSLRLRLRGSPSAPEPQRLSALSAADMPADEVVRALRSLDLISIQLAGRVHELRAAAARAAEGRTRPADADTALAAVEGTREELGAPATDPERPEARRRESGAGAEGEAAPAKVGPEPDAPVPPERQGRGMAWVAAVVALLVVVLLAWVLVRGSDSDYERAVSMFRAGRMDSAAVVFRQVLDDRPHHVSSMLYLGRIHRRQGELAEAAAVLRSAAGEAPRDPDVRRELGHLFMDLGQYRSAVGQYERALEYGPDDRLNWAALIRALRAADDPRAERLLEEAPADVQALLGRTEE